MTEKDIKIVELRVNGRQAAEQLWELKKRVKEWEQQKKRYCPKKCVSFSVPPPFC